MTLHIYTNSLPNSWLLAIGFILILAGIGKLLIQYASAYLFPDANNYKVTLESMAAHRYYKFKAKAQIESNAKRRAKMIHLMNKSHEIYIGLTGKSLTDYNALELNYYEDLRID